MGKIIEELEIKGDSSSAQKAAKGAEKSLTKAFIQSQIAVQAFNKAFSFFQTSIKQGFEDAMAYEQTTLRLSAALKKAGDTSAFTKRVFQAQAAEMERLTGISDEVFRSLQSMALEMGVSTGKVEQFVRAAQAISIQSGGMMSPEGAMKQLIKTLGGLQGELGEALPFIKELTKEQLMSGDAVRVINEEFGHLLNVGLRGQAGAMKELNMAWANFNERLALTLMNTGNTEDATKKLTAIVNKMTESVTFLIDKLRQLNWAFERLTPVGLAVLSAKYLGGKILDLTAEAAAGPAGVPQTPFFEQFPAPGTMGGGQRAPGGRGGKTVGGRKRKQKVTTYLPGEGPGAAWDPTSDIQARMEHQQFVADKIVEIERNKNQRIAEIERQSTEELIMAQQQDLQERAQMVTAALSIVGQAMGQALLKMLEGGKVVFANFFGEILKNVGMMVFSKGVADMAVATANALVYNMPNPLAFKAAGAEMAIGTTLMAGGVVAKKVASSMGYGEGGGGGTGGGGGVATTFTPGAAGGGGEGSETSGPKTVIINVSGAVTDAGVGVQIMDSLAEAKRQGYID